MPTSVRLDTETEALLRRLARERASSKSGVIRDALHALMRYLPGTLMSHAPIYLTCSEPGRKLALKWAG